MDLRIILDFDGVLFDSALEVYRVCQNLSKDSSAYRKNVSYEEFLNFRKYVTDAWQFSRLYSLNYEPSFEGCFSGDLSNTKDDDVFAERFFASRVALMNSEAWINYMKPYSIFYTLRNLMFIKPEVFSIISTRNRESIDRVLNNYGLKNILIYGQDEVKEYRGKLNLAIDKKIISKENLVVYIDDMSNHITPFKPHIDLCIHANWGYGVPSEQSYSQEQAISIVRGFFKVFHNSADT